jgi:phage/plasmid-associated DNA primase
VHLRCIDWQADGLAIPDSVRDCTAEYRAENDPLREWITDACTIDPDLYAAVADLRASYEKWATDNGEQPISAKTFGAKLTARGCTPDKLPGGLRIRRGIGLQENQP